MVANEIQIGGDHYKGDYQHWDWCVDINLGYLESAATKYISRWREKGGVQDLNKASHYLAKALEVKLEGRYRNHSFHNANTPSIRMDAEHYTNKFIKGLTDLTHTESNIIFRIATWRQDQELTEIIQLLNDFIAKEIPKGEINHPAPFGYNDAED